MGEKSPKREIKKVKAIKTKPIVEKVKTKEVVAEVSSRIRFCGCKTNSVGDAQGAEFQDGIYGRGHRVHTAGGKNSPSSKSRCTVCGK